MLAATSPGDFNLDGYVNAADYVLWRKTLNATAPVAGTGADGNGDGVVTMADRDTWRANFGSVTGDYNDNGTVDAADYVMLRKAASTVTRMAGDFVGTGNASIDPNAFAAWRAGFGNSGTAPGTPPVTNWFDTNVQDAALRSLGHSLYLDSVIDRGDMIALLTNVQDDGVVDATEFRDLQSIATNSATFGTPEAVRVLASYVVSGNAANEHYQGEVLGNLAAGTSAAQMQKLVDKWFRGLDRPATPYGYELAKGALFVDGAAYTDITQGNISDCYLLASLAEIAQHEPATLVNMFVVNGDGTYTVKFFNTLQTAYVTIDSYLPVDAAGRLIYAGVGKLASDPANELWVALAEKAYAQLNEMGWARQFLKGSGENAYTSLGGGYAYAVLAQVTGKATTAFTTTLIPTNFALFVDAYNQGKMIAFSSKAAPTSPDVVKNHAYAVISYDAENQTITMFNPWGIQAGLLTMTWAEIQGSFSYFDRTA